MHCIPSPRMSASVFSPDLQLDSRLKTRSRESSRKGRADHAFLFPLCSYRSPSCGF
ncbi:hypothetical protein BDV10DRAFT_169244 [Aspergillus recurvatus]